MSSSVLLLTEDNEGADELDRQLAAGGFDSVRVNDVDAAVDFLRQEASGLCLSDISFVEPLLAQRGVALPPVIAVDFAPDLEAAVAAVRRGARDYVVRGRQSAVLTKTRQHYRSVPAGQLILESANSRRCFELAARVASTDVSVLVSGESGTGKEVVARFVHNHSDRVDGPFVAINCAAIPDNMLEAILFGHVKGAFTGAHQNQPGKFELARGGTLLLDEISEMPLALQAKLLRVLQEREVERVGARAPISVDTRVIATTNVDIRQAVAEGSFREDLYYRLSVFPLKLHPLRERREDILPLVEHCIAKHANRLGKALPALAPDAAETLLAYDWPGNVRELENAVQRALVLSGGPTLDSADFDLPVALVARPASLAGQRDNAEADVILAALQSNRGQRKATAAQLGISERTLRYKLKRLRDAGVGEI